MSIRINNVGLSRLNYQNNKVNSATHNNVKFGSNTAKIADRFARFVDEGGHRLIERGETGEWGGFYEKFRLSTGKHVEKRTWINHRKAKKAAQDMTLERFDSATSKKTMCLIDNYDSQTGNHTFYHIENERGSLSVSYDKNGKIAEITETDPEGITTTHKIIDDGSFSSNLHYPPEERSFWGRMFYKITHFGKTDKGYTDKGICSLKNENNEFQNTQEWAEWYKTQRIKHMQGIN